MFKSTFYKYTPYWHSMTCPDTSTLIRVSMSKFLFALYNLTSLTTVSKFHITPHTRNNILQTLFQKPTENVPRSIVSGLRPSVFHGFSRTSEQNNDLQNFEQLATTKWKWLLLRLVHNEFSKDNFLVLKVFIRLFLQINTVARLKCSRLCLLYSLLSFIFDK